NGTSTQNRSEPPPSTWSPLPAMPVLSSHAPSLSGTSMARWPPPGMLVERTPTRDQPYVVDLEPVPLPQTFAPPRSSATIHSLRTTRAQPIRNVHGAMAASGDARREHSHTPPALRRRLGTRPTATDLRAAALLRDDPLSSYSRPRRASSTAAATCPSSRRAGE